MDNAAFQNADDAPAIAVLAAVRHCANSWEGSARLLGNVRAIDIARACSEAIAALNPNQSQPVSLLLRRLEIAQQDCMDDGQAAAAILLQDARAAIIASLSPARITGATDIVDEATCLIWSELCPGTVMGDEDRPYYEAAAKAVLAIAVEKCAKVCENLRHVDYPSETSEWSSGTFDCAQAIRELVRSAGPSDKGHLSCPDLSTLT